MRPSPLLRVAVVGSVAAVTGALLLAPASAADHSRSLHRGHAVFVQSDDPAGNTVVAYARAANGELTQRGVFSTGGQGGVLPGSVVDHLASQSSLVYDSDSRLLYAVNAGSDSVTVFAVRGTRLERRQVLSSGGSFPVSLAVHGNRVFVLNALGGGSVQGYLRVGEHLVRVPSWHRNLHLGTDANSPFTATPGQIGFDSRGTQLIVTTKGSTNSIDVLQLDRDGAPGAPVANVEPGQVPFAFVIDRDGRLVVAQAGTNSVATYRIGSQGRVHLLAQTATGQKATCWITRSGRFLYASNAGSNNVSGYRETVSGALASLGTTPTDPGTVDSTATPDGRYLYVQTGGQGIVDEFRIDGHGALTEIGTVAVPAGVGGEGIAAS